MYEYLSIYPYVHLPTSTLNIYIYIYNMYMCIYTHALACIYIYIVHMFEGHPAITRWDVSRCEAIKGMMYQGLELQLLWCENLRHPGSDNIEVPS